MLDIKIAKQKQKFVVNSRTSYSANENTLSLPLTRKPATKFPVQEKKTSKQLFTLQFPTQALSPAQALPCLLAPILTLYLCRKNSTTKGKVLMGPTADSGGTEDSYKQKTETGQTYSAVYDVKKKSKNPKIQTMLSFD